MFLRIMIFDKNDPYNELIRDFDWDNDGRIDQKGSEIEEMIAVLKSYKVDNKRIKI